MSICLKAYRNTVGATGYQKGASNVVSIVMLKNIHTKHETSLLLTGYRKLYSWRGTSRRIVKYRNKKISKINSFDFQKLFFLFRPLKTKLEDPVIKPEPVMW